MVKHIVLFKLKDEVPAEEKLEVMTIQGSDRSSSC